MILPGQHWYAASSCDPRGMRLYLDHYSAKPHPNGRTSRHFVSGGYRMVLLTPHADALWVWQLMRAEHRRDGQSGVYCAIFRNEGAVRSSVLILEAEQLAWARWPGQRLFTFVDPTKVQSALPGFCFLAARWRHAGMSKRGLLRFEKWPKGKERR